MNTLERIELWRKYYELDMTVRFSLINNSGDLKTLIDKRSEVVYQLIKLGEIKI